MVRGFITRNIVVVRSSEICEELSRPNMIAILEILAIIQALIIDADNPENIAKHQMTMRIKIILYLRRRKKNILFSRIANTVMLYPDADMI